MLGALSSIDSKIREGNRKASLPIKKKPKPSKRLNIMVCGESGIGKSSLIEHLLLSLNEESARDLFKQRVKSPVPFGNLVNQTKKIVSYPIYTEDYRLQLIDCQGYSRS